MFSSLKFINIQLSMYEREAHCPRAPVRIARTHLYRTTAQDFLQIDLSGMKNSHFSHLLVKHFQSIPNHHGARNNGLNADFFDTPLLLFFSPTSSPFRFIDSIIPFSFLIYFPPVFCTLVKSRLFRTSPIKNLGFTRGNF